MLEKIEINQSVIELAQGDITAEETDAIVNAANKELSPGAGVSGAIHKKAGPNLWEDTKQLGGCATGEAKITYGYNLRARYVVHTVGPVYSGSADDARLLRSCYLQSLQVAADHDAKSISFPAISTGVFGYPVAEAAAVSLQAVRDFLEERTDIAKVRFVLFSDQDYAAYQAALQELTG